MRSTGRAVAALAIATLLLAGCGGDELEPIEDIAPPDETDETEPDEPEVEPEEPSEDEDLPADEPEVEVEADPEPATPEEPDDQAAAGEPAPAEDFPDLPEPPFDVASSPMPDVPFPTDFVSMGRSAEAYETDGGGICNYRQEFETQQPLRETAQWFTDLIEHHGYDLDQDMEEVIGTDWGDPDSPEFPGYYSVGATFPESIGPGVGISFEVTVFDVTTREHRGVYVQRQSEGPCP